MSEQPVVTTLPTKPVMRGWREICPYVGLKSYRAARRHLEALGVLVYVFGRPILSVDAYRLALLRIQQAPRETDETPESK